MLVALFAEDIVLLPKYSVKQPSGLDAMSPFG
jgi:hypothetical protein